MKKWVGFGILLALIVVPVGIANAQSHTVNLFPIAFGTFAGHDTYLAVTNLTQNNFVADPNQDGDPIDGNGISIRSATQGGTAVNALSDLAPGETRVYASNLSVAARNFGCTDDICTVAVCAPTGASPLNTTGDENPAVPAISSALFWLNNGQFYAITTPIIALGNLADCTIFGAAPPGPPPTDVIP